MKKFVLIVDLPEGKEILSDERISECIKDAGFRIKMGKYDKDTNLFVDYTNKTIGSFKFIEVS